MFPRAVDADSSRFQQWLAKRQEIPGGERPAIEFRPPMTNYRRGAVDRGPLGVPRAWHPAPGWWTTEADPVKPLAMGRSFTPPQIDRTLNRGHVEHMIGSRDDDAMKIFLSHSSRDKPFVRELASNLPPYIARWLDEEQLLFGMNLPTSLESAIGDESDFVIIFLSKEAVSSKWVQKEFGYWIGNGTSSPYHGQWQWRRVAERKPRPRRGRTTK